MISLTVYFCDPFWVGVFELTENKKLRVCKITFGAEPKDYYIFDFILNSYYDLEFGNSNTLSKLPQIIENPKRRVRAAAKLISQRGVATNSQLAIKFDREQLKAERKKSHRLEKDMIKNEKFIKKQLKKKEKHRGN